MCESVEGPRIRDRDSGSKTGSWCWSFGDTGNSPVWKTGRPCVQRQDEVAEDREMVAVGQ